MSEKLIVGCGYLGMRIARRWLEAGHKVFGVVRHVPDAPLAASPPGLRLLAADVTDPDSLRALPQAETVVYCVGYDPSGTHSRRQLYVDGLRNTLAAIQRPERVILISSTGVYGEASGGWVDEDSPCRPTREAGHALLAAEEVLHTDPLGRRAIILRLAGLYGPGRLPRTADLVARRPMPVPEGAWVNLIHVDDAAAVVLAAEARANPPRTYIVSDGAPVERREYLRELARRMGLPEPVFYDAPATSRGAGDKRTRSARMFCELGVRLEYPSYREGLGARDEGREFRE